MNWPQRCKIFLSLRSITAEVSGEDLSKTDLDERVWRARMMFNKVHALLSVILVPRNPSLQTWPIKTPDAHWKL